MTHISFSKFSKRESISYPAGKIEKAGTETRPGVQRLSSAKITLSPAGP